MERWKHNNRRGNKLHNYGTARDRTSGHEIRDPEPMRAFSHTRGAMRLT